MYFLEHHDWLEVHGVTWNVDSVVHSLVKDVVHSVSTQTRGQSNRTRYLINKAQGVIDGHRWGHPHARMLHDFIIKTWISAGMLKSSCPYEYFPEYGISDALLFLSFISPLGKDLLFPPLNCTQDFIKGIILMQKYHEKWNIVYLRCLAEVFLSKCSQILTDV